MERGPAPDAAARIVTSMFVDTPVLDLVTAIMFVLAIATVVWLFFYPVLARDRVRAHDRAISVSRDVKIPPNCASCRSPHASQPLPVRVMFFGVGPVAQMLDRGRYVRDFTFHFCVRCALPIRRRRRQGRVVMILGAIVVAAGLPLAILMGGGPWLIAMPLSMLVGPVAALLGFWMSHYSPAVRILDMNEDKLLFEFKSQLFCDEFAELNGEPLPISPRSSAPASRP